MTGRLRARCSQNAISSLTSAIEPQGCRRRWALNLRAERSDAEHDYRLRGLLRCALCERAFEGHWVNQTPGYRCRHGHNSAIDPGTPRPKSVYLCDDCVLAKLPLLHHLLTAAEPAAAITGASASAARPIPTSPEEVINYLRTNTLMLRYDSRTRTLETGRERPVRITIGTERTLRTVKQHDRDGGAGNARPVVTRRLSSRNAFAGR